MAKRHLYLPSLLQAPKPHTAIALTPAHQHHLKNVLRLPTHTAITFTDGLGSKFEGTFMGDFVECTSAPQHQPLQTTTLTLAVGIAKNNTMEWLIEKAVEAGAHHIRPIMTERSVVKISKSDNKHVTKWQTLADQALEQTEGVWRTTIHPPQSLSEILKSQPDTQHLSFDADMRHQIASSAEWSTTQKLLQLNNDSPICLYIGPEGGFSDTEVDLLRQTGLALSLGSTVYRVETAAIAALTLAKFLVYCRPN